MGHRVAAVYDPLIRFLAFRIVPVEVFLPESGGYRVPAGAASPVRVPLDEDIAEIIFRHGAAEVRHAELVDRGIAENVGIGRAGVRRGRARFARIEFLDEDAEPFEVLAPVIIGIGDVAIAFLRSSGGLVEIGEIGRIGENRNGENPESDGRDRGASRQLALEPASPGEIEDRFRDEDVQERENRKEVTKTDIEVARYGNERIEGDEAEHRVLRDMTLEGVRENVPWRAHRLVFESAPDPIESVEQAEDEEEKKRERFLEEEDDGKVPRIRVGGHVTHEEMRVASGDSGEDLEGPEEVLGDGFADRRIGEERDGSDGEARRFVVLREEILGRLDHFHAGLVYRVYGVGRPDKREADEDRSRVAKSVSEELTCEEDGPRIPYRVGLRPRKRVDEDNEAEIGENECGGELDQLRDSEEDAEEDRVSRRRLSEEADEKVKCQKEPCGDAEVGRDIVSVRDDVRIGGVEKKREESGDGTGELLRPAVNESAEEKRDEDNRHAGPEHDHVGVVAGFEDEPLAEHPLLVHSKTPFVGFDRECDVHEEERKSGEILEERRMLGVEPHVAVADIRIGGRDMRFLVERGRLLPGERK